MDTVDKATRSKIMSKVGQKATGPEMKLRLALHKAGFRYRVNVRDLPGSPDLVFPKYRAVIFVHGCFWHRHKGCKYTTIPKDRFEFWNAKFDANVARDAKNVDELEKLGWRVLIVWECELKEKKTSNFDNSIDDIMKWLFHR
jgi:DNA mismatch endonuclease (patch repair protein)